MPDAAFAAALLRAVAGPGLATASISVREAADSASIAALAAAPGAAQQLAGLDLEFRAAPTAEDVAALAACGSLKRLHVSCKCPRAPPGVLDWQPWLALRSLEHLHLHINPAWRAPLQPAAVAAMAAAWPRLTHLHLRLSPSDNATHALQQLRQFKALKSLSLTWLGQAAATGTGHAGGRLRRTSSLECAAFNLAHLPAGLEELNLTSISTVRLGLPPPPCQQPAQQLEPAAAVPFAPPKPFVYMVPSAPSAPVLPSLRGLVLDGNFGLSDELFDGLLSHAPKLDSLNLVLAGGLEVHRGSCRMCVPEAVVPACIPQCGAHVCAVVHARMLWCVLACSLFTLAVVPSRCCSSHTAQAARRSAAPGCRPRCLRPLQRRLPVLARTRASPTSASLTTGRRPSA